MVRFQIAEMIFQIQIAFVADTEIHKDRLSRALRQRLFDNGFYRRQAGPAGQRDNRTGMGGAVVGNTMRTVHLNAITDILAECSRRR